MKLIGLASLALLFACNSNNNGTVKVKDSTEINTNTGNYPDGGPNRGLPDTTPYNRMNDTITHDTTGRR
jgi:hypothetical protein